MLLTTITTIKLIKKKKKLLDTSEGEFEVSAKNPGGTILQNIRIMWLLFKKELRELHIWESTENWTLKPGRWTKAPEMKVRPTEEAQAKVRESPEPWGSVQETLPACFIWAHSVYCWKTRHTKLWEKMATIKFMK